MDRYWLLTWTTYATWLPGDPRGFVSNIADDTGKGIRHNVPGTPCDADVPALRQYMRQRLKGNPVYLDRSQADLLLKQFQETAAYRGWSLLAAAVMPNHVHLVVAVAGDPDPASLLRDFKSYGSRALRVCSKSGRARLLPSRLPPENRLGRSLALPDSALSEQTLIVLLSSLCSL